ncbi:zinc ribbon domain-containing protein [Candidatus Oscillochloris fontis]|uniref:zinc ribbon domain-containing protein n=1 Tax=Candidatus Oscillochloris fontis TaxID=2496868 RepID=UPI00101C3755|nr:zinc ribbon domain-containing protein [Candidatus Oscillochloris fontis]
MEAIQNLLANVIPLLMVLGVLLGAYLILLWAASVLWTYRDIRQRSEDVSVQVLAVGMVLLLPFAGIPLHMILRPPQTLAEKYERSLEEEYLRNDIEDKFVCPECQRPIEPDFILCPHCTTALRRRCEVCSRVVDLTWTTCPYCGDTGTPAARQATTAVGVAYPARRGE